MLTAPTSTSPVTSPQGRERPYRLGLRFLIALAFAALVAGWWWSRQPRQLDISTDILGYPTFANFDYTRTFTAYRLIVYAVPGLTALGYLVLARWGPLRRPDRPPRPQIPLTDAVGSSTPSQRLPRTPRANPTPRGRERRRSTFSRSRFGWSCPRAWSRWA